MEKKKVFINDVEYTLDSDNTTLLKLMPPVKVKDPKTGKWVDKEYPYIPIGIIRTLLGGLTDSYDFFDLGAKFTGEEFKIEKEYNGEKKVDIKRVYEYSVKFVITLDGVTRTLDGYCRGVASQSILANDGSANGFFQKLSARATKAALKHFAKIFRMDDEADDVLEGDTDASTTGNEKIAQVPYEPKTLKKKQVVAKTAATPADAVMADIDKAEPKPKDSTENTETANKKGQKSTKEIAEHNEKMIEEIKEEKKIEDLGLGEEGKWMNMFAELIDQGSKQLSDLNQLVIKIRKDDNVDSKDAKRLETLRNVYNEAKKLL